MSNGLQSGGRRRDRAGRHADAAAAARARLPGARDRAVRVRALGRTRARRRRSSSRPRATSRSRASTSRCSPPAARPRASGRRASPRPARSSSTTPRAGAWSDDVPLVVSEVNPEALAAHQRHHRQPELLDDADGRRAEAAPRRAGIERLVICTYQAVSGTGQAAPSTSCSTSPTRCCTSRTIAAPEAYAHQIAFNALPHAGNFAAGDDHTDEERKLINETRKILGDPTIAVSATCVRVPVVNGHSEAVNVQTREPLSPERARELLARPRRTVLDDPRRRALPARDRRRRPATRCSSGASAATPATSARSTCGSSPTTCARAPRPTPCRSPSCCTSAG